MKVLVCGDRNWTDVAAIRRELVKFPKGTSLIHGNCRGADKISGRVGDELSFNVKKYDAKWERDGDAAGPIRNQLMLEENPDIDLVLAFHANLGESRGTADMLRRAEKAGIPAKVISR